MESVTLVKNLDEAVSISFCTKTLGKVMTPSLLPPRHIVGWTGRFNLRMATSLEKENNSNQLLIFCCNLTVAEGLGKYMLFGRLSDSYSLFSLAQGHSSVAFREDQRHYTSELVCQISLITMILQ